MNFDREFSRQLELAVQDIQRKEHLMSSLIVLECLLQIFQTGIKKIKC